MTLSVAITTFNSAGTIGKVIRSVESICDEVVVLDSGSSDGTVSIARSLGATVYSREFDNFVNQKNHLVSLCRGKWILFIDDDEVVSEELANSIKKSVGEYSGKAGYYVNVLTNYLGRWIKHAWYPDWHLRLAMKGRCRWVGDFVHERLEVDGPAGYLKGNLLHYSYGSIKEHIEKINMYTTMYAAGRRRSGAKFSLLKLIFSPPAAFFRRYILKMGFLDGFEGFVLSTMASYYTFLKYLKLWEIEKIEKTGNS